MPGTFRPPLATLLVAALVVPTSRAEDAFRPAPDRHGILDLPADRAILLGDRLRLAPDRSFVAEWASAAEEVRWDFVLDSPGRFVLVVEYAAPPGRGGAVMQVVAADQVRQAPVHATGAPTRFYPQPLKGAIHLPSGRNRLEVRAVEVPRGLVMNLRRVRLVPAEE